MQISLGFLWCSIQISTKFREKAVTSGAYKESPKFWNSATWLKLQKLMNNKHLILSLRLLQGSTNKIKDFFIFYGGKQNQSNNHFIDSWNGVQLTDYICPGCINKWLYFSKVARSVIAKNQGLKKKQQTKPQHELDWNTFHGDKSHNTECFSMYKAIIKVKGSLKRIELLSNE